MYNGKPLAKDAGKRAYEELCRIANREKPTRFAERIGITKPSPSHWGRGIAPSLMSLNRLHYAGADIIYIVTGERK